ncbi:helix-turn-helix transcriptional regulator [Weissella confusa]|uniref:Helix-turn-helix transcriptional regulator n=1 Tax=Weissella confusa TaxID=1583 RepID=A0AAE2S5M3_WEICO|nr:helix-turn-helix transcriptional regulator [Weissella confusa]MBJ7631651.1 helix-turn-helix transcriptional regulator [Weissella confusa]MBJ7644424.1 helix-turn-helix transcriptional regulator [Weissella confusa]TGE53979.1 hypothetical protein C6P22_03695 [Weissella confusa]
MNRIKELREKRNLTLRELEKEVGISFGALGNYENERREPRLKAWKTLADYFGVPVAYLQGVSDVRHGGDVNSVDAKAIQLEIDHGVKLQIPIDIYNNTDMFEINHNADGTETLTIKNVEHVTSQFK